MQKVFEALAQGAAEADRVGVDRALLLELAAPDFLAPFLDPQRLPEQLPLLERLSEACGLTTFVFLQHVAAVRILPRLAESGRLSGIAMAHARWPGPPCVTVREGRLHGTAPWFTGWGVMDSLIVAAEGPTLWHVPVSAPGLTASEEHGLAVMGASATVSLHFEGVRAERVGPLPDRAEPWIDVREAALPLGAAQGAARLLGHGGLQEQIDDLRRRVRAWEGTATDLRVEALDLGLRATQAALVVAGGRGNRLDHPAQRWAREAMFYALMAGKKEALVEALISSPSSRAARPSGVPG